MKFFNLIFLFFLVLAHVDVYGQEGGTTLNNEVYREVSSEQSVLKIEPELVKQHVQTLLDTIRLQKYMPDKDLRRYLHSELENFYKARDYQLAWYTPLHPRSQTDSIIAAINRALEEGMDPVHYNMEEVEQRIKRMYNRQVTTQQLSELVKLDFLTTSSALTYASHLFSGKIDPTELNSRWKSSARQMDLAGFLNASVEENSLLQSLKSLNPVHDQYKRLKEALVHYRTLQQEGGWPKIPEDRTLQYGDTAEAVVLLRQRLAATGDLQASEVHSAWMNVFDTNLQLAVEHFQQRNGLQVDGIAGPATFGELNVPVEDRVAQIEVNLERMRWLPDGFGDKYIKVNIPEFKLRVFEQGKEVIDMKIVVGKEYYSTPIFSDTMHYIEFSPTWTLPLSIAGRDILPKLKKDPGYLARNNYRIYDSWTSNAEPIDPYTVDWSSIAEKDFKYKVVQAPGPHNSLGLVKFMFPNKMSIYMHDTPAEYLFDRNMRGYSSGCIRLEKPVELAAYLLKDRNISQSDILSYMHLDEPYALSVADQNVHIEIIYRTAWVDDGGVVNFRNDIYGYDQVQISALQKKAEQLDKW
jgi:murein L,D-transpeptidase YcbB/YkuD